MEIVKFDEMKKTWSEIAKNHKGDIQPNFELEVYKKMLEVFHVGNFYYYIFNVATAGMEFVSNTIHNILGINPEDFSAEYIFEYIHSDDLNRFAAHEKEVTRFFGDLTPEEVLRYKVSYDYRLRCADGTYKWILMQTLTLQSDEQGSVIRVLGVQTDITHLKTEDKPSGLSFIGLNGAPSYYNVQVGGDVLLSSKEPFSKREKEVLQLVLSGKNSHEIADILSLSVHTVNSHRKNIFAKSDCKSLAELGYKAVKMGWL